MRLNGLLWRINLIYKLLVNWNGMFGEIQNFESTLNDVRNVIWRLKSIS